MKLYKREGDATTAVSDNTIFIAKYCPFHVRMSSRALCGNWCPHFFIDEGIVYITCNGTETNVGEVDE